MLDNFKNQAKIISFSASLWIKTAVDMWNENIINIWKIAMQFSKGTSHTSFYFMLLFELKSLKSAAFCFYNKLLTATFASNCRTVTIIC